MKKFLSTFILNAIFALIGVGVTIWQEFSIFPAQWGLIGTCCGAAAGGSLLAEGVKIVGAERDFSVWQVVVGAVIGIVAAAIVLVFTV